MEEPSFSPVVEKFIGEHISSVAQLETLLLMQTNGRQVWSAGDIARELRIEVSGAEGQLETLREAGLVVREEGGYRYGPARVELHEAAVAVAQAYLARRVAVIGLIFAKPSRPASPANLRAFSEAFRIRKDASDGGGR